MAMSEKIKFKRRLSAFGKQLNLPIGMKFFNQQKRNLRVGYYRSGLYFDLAEKSWARHC